MSNTFDTNDVEGKPAPGPHSLALDGSELSFAQIPGERCVQSSYPVVSTVIVEALRSSKQVLAEMTSGMSGIYLNQASAVAEACCEHWVVRGLIAGDPIPVKA